MKNAITIFILILFANSAKAQTHDFINLWQKVEQQESKGLTKSALETVTRISEKAKSENNSAQTIKALLHKSKYVLILEEDAQLNIINAFKSEIETNSIPTKNVLENILATLYWQYFQEHRYQFYNRTKTATKVEPNDFRTWDLQTLFSEIHEHYKNSLQNGLLLQQTNLKKFEAILHLSKGSRDFRPTLFDLLNHNALAFYKSKENSITNPSYKFEIDQPDYLSESSKFSKLKIASKDSTSLQLQALKVYQNLIQFHLKDKSPDALADVNIQRLKFAYQNATFQGKDNHYLKTLQKESERLKTRKTSGLYDYEIASLLFKQGLDYKPKTKTENRWKKKEALAICNTVISRFHKSVAAKKCESLRHQILQKTIQITAENNMPIQQESKLLVSYQNLKSLKFTSYKLSNNQLKQFNKTYRQEEKIAFLKKLTIASKWHSTLRDESDYQTHSSEISIPKLDNGQYVITATEGQNIFAFKSIQIANLALVENTTNTDISFQVIDRNNGKPIPEAKVKISYQKGYNGNHKSESLITNTSGEVSLKKGSDRYTNVNIEVIHHDEKAYFGNYYIYNRRENNVEENNETYKGFLFTDRGIYRPGQTVYFKGIAMKTNDGKSEVLAKEAVYATLYDAHGNEVKDIEFITNEFGSISGEFIVPNSGLTGLFYIEFDGDDKNLYAEQYFSVEEYKRPKFKTTFNPITETFKINDSITIKGKALAYASSNITDAKVVYRVHRKVQFPSWYYWHRPAFHSEPQEITHGESITDASGNFEIKFKALADQSVAKNNLPIFQYEVTADVTDLNNETRRATTTVNIGYHALLANLAIDTKLDKSKKDHSITIDTKNLNAEFVPATGLVKIYKLNAPKSVLRQRPWPAPDYQVFSKDEFREKFPHEAYNNEHDSKNWTKGALVFEDKFDTRKSKTLELRNIKNWESGEYLISLESKDKFGQSVKDDIKTTLFSEKDKTLADKQLFRITTDKPFYNINDAVKITLASAATDIYVTVEIEKDHKIISQQTILLSNTKKTITIPVTPDDIGGFAIHYSFSAFNVFQSSSLNIAVPHPKTELEIETLTFRDKLQPGTDETWRFKIKGLQGEKVSAELLASMYDASLDQFKTHNWNFNPIDKPIYNSYSRKNSRQSFGISGFRIYNSNHSSPYYSQQGYDQLNWFGFYFGSNRKLYRRKNMNNKGSEKQIAAAPMEEAEEMKMDDAVLDEVVVTALSGKVGGLNTESEAINKTKFDDIQIRKNLQETAFFFPQLQTDKAGDISFRFTTPEALTQWKLQLLAHTKTLNHGVTSLETVTQKELMVIPNPPRFLREGDEIVISTKISNLTDKAVSGEAVLQLFDALTGENIDKKLYSEAEIPSPNYSGMYGNREFNVDAKGNIQVAWVLQIPDDVQAVKYKIIAKSENYSDGEQNVLPVLTNRKLVTETLPMWVRSNQTKTFTLDKLKTHNSSTLKHHKLTLEMTSNPAWYAVQALPYLMEYPHDCNEQLFSRYYANVLASHIANSNPRIQEVFKQWASQDALVSNLEKNPELKSILIQETPWLRDAQSETEQKKRIALLFDLNKMTNELQLAKRKLEQNQMNNGAWSWFAGGRENRYITQHIITGFGHLKQLGVAQNDIESQMIQKAITYLDDEFINEYKNIRKYNAKADLSKDHLSYTQLHYLYMRSFFPDLKKSEDVQEITNYYKTQIQKYWLSRSLYAKGMMALVSSRLDDAATANVIVKSLKETSITSNELGMYWKSNTNSWFWYQAPIETQALLIEVFSEIDNDSETIDNLKIWLLKHKQTNRWKTTKATTDAIYAILLQGSNWLSVTEMVDVIIGNEKIEPKKLENVSIEAGTGYYKTSWSSSEIKPEMADVTLTKKGNGIAWGNLNWQYFEDLDKITSAETPLKIKKKLFLKKNTDLGEEISEITLSSNLQVGDLVRVRIELKVDRPMEFIHMKDMRASGLEPVNVFSQYKWQDGLGYYESTKDASTNFFFDYLPKGIFVFEYDLRINNSGYMSNGITTIQSMYAPEFSSHSEGIKIRVE